MLIQRNLSNTCAYGHLIEMIVEQQDQINKLAEKVEKLERKLDNPTRLE